MADDRRLERIEAKIDDLGDEVAEVNVILSAQHVSITEHIRRTELLENEMVPMRKSVYMVKGALALLGIISLIVGILEYFKK